jgi:hypothetical protein
MNHVFAIVDKDGKITIVDKEMTVYLVRESALEDAIQNEEPIKDIHPSLCEEYDLEVLLTMGHLASEFHLLDEFFTSPATGEQE